MALRFINNYAFTSVFNRKYMANLLWFSIEKPCKSTHQAPRIQYTFWNGESIDLKKYKDK